MIQYPILGSQIVNWPTHFKSHIFQSPPCVTTLKNKWPPKKASPRKRNPPPSPKGVLGALKTFKSGESQIKLPGKGGVMSPGGGAVIVIHGGHFSKSSIMWGLIYQKTATHKIQIGSENLYIYYPC